MYSPEQLFLCSLEYYLSVHFTLCFTTQEINTKITLSWALKQFVAQVNTLFCISQNNHNKQQATCLAGTTWSCFVSPKNKYLFLPFITHWGDVCNVMYVGPCYKRTECMRMWWHGNAFHTTGSFMRGINWSQMNQKIIKCQFNYA